MKKTSLAVMRLQPLHYGHKLIIDSMLSASDQVVVGVGSIDKSDDRNPFSFEVRSEMIRAVYGDKITIIALKDINAPTKKLWAEYVLKEVLAQSGLTPTHYYAGSAQDGSWFEEFLPVTIADRKTAGKDISATMIRERIKRGEDISQFVPKEVISIIRKHLWA